MKNGKMLSLEDELCELLHENSQLKNYLKEVSLIVYFLNLSKRTEFKKNCYLTLE